MNLHENIDRIKQMMGVLSEDATPPKEHIMRQFGYYKQIEKILPDGTPMEGYANEDRKYSIRVMLINKDGKDYAKIMYNGPRFDDPQKIEEEDLTIKWFQQKWISLSKVQMFVDALKEGHNYAKSIRNYHGVQSLPPRR
jgi:hypothetical protein